MLIVWGSFKTRPQHRCFPVNIAELLRLPPLRNICKWLLFDCFNSSMLHGPKDSRSTLYDDESQAQFFVFKSASLILNRIPACVQKPKADFISCAEPSQTYLFLPKHSSAPLIKWNSS